jgi:hypothetical protein
MVLAKTGTYQRVFFVEGLHNQVAFVKRTLAKVTRSFQKG